MNNRLKGICAMALTLSLLTVSLTACGKKIERKNNSQQNYVNTQDGTYIENPVDGIDNGGSYVDDGSGFIDSGSDYSGGDSSSYNGGSDYSDAGYSGSDYVDPYSGSDSYVTPDNPDIEPFTSAVDPSTTTTRANTALPVDVPKVLNSAKLNPMKTNDETLDSQVDAILSEILTDNMTTNDKVRTIHDYLVQTNRYGTLIAIGSDTNYVSLYDRDVVTRAKTILKYKTGTCIDFAAAFMIFTRRIGLDCYMITGNVINRYGKSSPHGWNVIKINGKDYVFDSEADFRYSNGGPTKFINFCVDDPEKFKDTYTKLAVASFKNFRYV